MSKKLDLTGHRFGKLIVIEKTSERKNESIVWKCKCDCGKEVLVPSAYLITGHKSSCGCLRWQGTPKHGLSNSLIRNCYYNMRQRCNSPKNKSYNDYGGRGITYCDKWNTFEGFLDDMFDTYEEGLTLDRIDVNGNYCKENCRWADRIVQANNTRKNHYFEYNGEKLTISELARKYNIGSCVLYDRIFNQGMTVREALKKPKHEEITYNGITKTVIEFAEEYGMTYYQLKKRLMRGWTIERALTQPLRKNTE